MALWFLCPAQASLLSHCFHKEVTDRLPGCRPFSQPFPSLLSFPRSLENLLLFLPCCPKSQRGPDVRTSGSQMLSTV